MKKIGLALCLAMALLLALAGCGGSSGSPKSSDAAAQGKAAFAGTWVLKSMQSENSITTEDDLKVLDELGLEVYLVLDSGADAKASFVLFGEATNGTWKAESAESATLTLEKQVIAMALEDDELTLEQGASKLTFKKGEDRELPSGESASSAAAASSGAAEPSKPDGANKEENLFDDSDRVVLADDEIATVTVVGMVVDMYGDPGYYLEIVNNTEDPLVVSTRSDSFSVNGMLQNAWLYAEVDGGKTVGDAFLYFDREETGLTGLSDLEAVEGTIVVEDANTYEVLTEYGFQM
ncbi:MAG: hypothetical protein IJH04_09255 [Eggerthellaceae bacterium]|nr:hypothetical protein [Eggerthellaceae bacterium]